MGWLCGEKPAEVKKYLDSRFNETVRVLDSAIVNRTEYYAAIEYFENGQHRVTCAVYLLKFYRTKYGLMEMCCKDMDEYCGPNASNCPERILRKLTPLPEDGKQSTQWAREWRERCWANVTKRKAARSFQPGQRLQYGGREYTVDEKLERRGYRVHDEYGSIYRLNKAQAAKCEVLA